MSPRREFVISIVLAYALASAGVVVGLAVAFPHVVWPALTALAVLYFAAAALGWWVGGLEIESRHRERGDR